MRQLALVGIGGAIGSIARHLLAGAVQRWSGSGGFPYGTLAVNVLGSFLIALALYDGGGRAPSPSLPAEVRLFVATGVLGGFTTYSAFNQATLDLARSGAVLAAAANIAATLLACLVAGTAGLLLARLIFGS